jgi:hypothetical protein
VYESGSFKVVSLVAAQTEVQWEEQFLQELPRTDVNKALHYTLLLQENYCKLEIKDLLATMQLSIFCLPTCYLYKTMILPALLYGCETWFLMLREEQRLSG